MPKNAARLLVDCLVEQGCDRLFTVPGESFLPVLDALRDCEPIQTIVCRHEGGASYMACADGAMTGRPGIAFVTRGPGATNASIGVHVAFQDSQPMILFVGDVDRGMRDREGFQEIDFPSQSSEGRPGVPRPTNISRSSPSALACLSRRHSGGRTLFRLPQRSMPATLASVRTRNSSNESGRPIWCWWWARASEKRPPTVTS